MRKSAIISTVLLSICFAGSGVHSQMARTHPYNLSESGITIYLGEPENAGDRIFARQNFRRLSAERRKRITADGAKLLRLATDLKTQFEDGNQSMPPEEAIREAEEIAKLAHGIRERMIETF
jgi:hypothetical protein